MFHDDIIPIVTCLASTLCHFYTFFGTNLLIRCHSASSCFLLFLYSRKASQEIFLELDENSRRHPFYQDTHGVQRRDEEEPEGPHTHPGRARGGPRALATCGAYVVLLCWSFGPSDVFWQNRDPREVSSNSENISWLAFLEYKNSRKQELALRHLVNRLVPKNV